MCYFPPLLAGFRCRWWCAAPRHSWLGPAGCGGVFRGWGCPLLCVFVVCVGVRGGCAVLCVACLWCLRCWWCGVVVQWVCLPHVLVCVVACVWCAGGLCLGAPAPCLSRPLALGVVPRHSWLGSTGCGGGGPGCPSPWSWRVCVRCVALRVGVGGVGGSCAVWLPCVCVCVLAVCGLWGVSYLGWFSSSVVGMVQKAEEEVPPSVFSSPVEKERVQVFWLFLRVVPCVSSFFFSVASSITHLFALCFPYREGVEGAFVFFSFFRNILVIPCAASCCRPL